MISSILQNPPRRFVPPGGLPTSKPRSNFSLTFCYNVGPTPEFLADFPWDRDFFSRHYCTEQLVPQQNAERALRPDIVNPSDCHGSSDVGKASVESNMYSCQSSFETPVNH